MTRPTLSAAILFVLALELLVTGSAGAKPIGADAPVCPTCCGLSADDFPSGEKPCTDLRGGSLISASLGTMGETHSVVSAPGANGAGFDLSLQYASYVADGEKASVATVMGYGWSHSYNLFVFTQGSDLYKMSPGGFVTKYQRSGRSGPLAATRAMQQDIIQNADGSIEIINRAGGTVYRFEQIPNNPLRVAGTVPWMLTRITDRNQNRTHLTYTGGLLTQVTDPFGRIIEFVNENQRLVRIQVPIHDPSDPSAPSRVTRLEYDGYNNLVRIIDPEEHSIRYGYNARHQIVSKVDQNGRTWNYQYDSAGHPVGIQDGTGTRVFSMTNDQNWGTNSTDLLVSKQRTYLTNDSSKVATTTRTDGNGKTWQHQYDRNGMIRAIVSPAPELATTSYTYDPVTLNGRLRDRRQRPPHRICL